MPGWHVSGSLGEGVDERVVVGKNGAEATASKTDNADRRASRRCSPDHRMSQDMVLVVVDAELLMVSGIVVDDDVVVVELGSAQSKTGGCAP